MRHYPQQKDPLKIHFYYRTGPICRQSAGFAMQPIATEIRLKVTCGKCIKLMSKIKEHPPL